MAGASINSEEVARTGMINKQPRNGIDSHKLSELIVKSREQSATVQVSKEMAGAAKTQRE